MAPNVAKDYEAVIESKDPNKISMPDIEVVQYRTRKHPGFMQYQSDEFTAVCPKTGLPDFYKVDIIYEPNEYLPELKSLKLYLVAWRNIGIFHEHLSARILDDFVGVVQPQWALVRLQAKERGGIGTTCFHTHNMDNSRIKDYSKFLKAYIEKIR